MFSKPEQLGRALIKIDTYPSIAVKRNKLIEVVDLFPQETSFIFSVSYRFSGCVVPSPVKTQTPKITENWEVIMGNILYFLHRQDNTAINKYYLSLPYQWQVIVYYCINKTIRNSIGATKYLETIKELYTQEDLIAMVVLPETISDAFEVQQIKRNSVETITAPIEILQGLKRQNMSHIYYMLNYGTKIVSNNKYNSSRASILSNIGAGRYGVLFTESKQQGYKYKRVQDIIAIGTVEDIINAYKGISTANIDVKLKSLGIFNSIEDIAKQIKDLRSTQHLLLKSGTGLHTIKLIDEIRTVKVVDYITSEDFKPIGVKIEINENTYPIYFNVSNTSLSNGIKNKYVRVIVKTFYNDIVKVIFHSVVKDTDMKQCALCSKYVSRISSSGLCLGCTMLLRKKLSTGEIMEYDYSGFSFISDIWNYTVVGDGKTVSFNCNTGQMILPLG